MALVLSAVSAVWKISTNCIALDGSRPKSESAVFTNLAGTFSS